MSASLRAQDLVTGALGQNFLGKVKALVGGASALVQGDAVVVTANTFDADRAIPRGGTVQRADATPTGVVFIASNAVAVGGSVVLVAWLPFQFNTTGATIGDPVYVSATGGPTLTDPGAGSLVYGSVVTVGTVAAGGSVFLSATHAISDAALEADAPLLQASGTIAAGAVATLFATPIEMVAAPAAGKYLEPVSLHWWLDFETAAYDGNAAGEDLVVKYTNAAGDTAMDTVDEAGFADAIADAHRTVYGIAVAPVAAAALVAHILVAEWFGAAGDSPLKWEMLYRVRDLEF